MIILTDANGRPIARPQREEFNSDIEYLRAFNAWKDKIAGVANRAFSEKFIKVIRLPKKGRGK